MRTCIEIIQEAIKTPLMNNSGDTISVSLLPALTSTQINDLEAKHKLRIPEELRVLLGFCSGIEGLLEYIDFTGSKSDPVDAIGVFVKVVPIAGDVLGNIWFLDVGDERLENAPVFFLCHDPPVVIYQSPNVASFLEEVVRIYLPPHKSLVLQCSEDAIFRVWEKNPGVIERNVAVSSGDQSLKAFAGMLTNDFQIVDLRRAEPGMGFSWGRYGSQTEVRRYGQERIFAYSKPATKPGLLAMLRKLINR